MKPFSPELKAKVKHLYVNKGLSALAISEKYKGSPSAQTVNLWVKKDKWDNLRADFMNDSYEKFAPQNLVLKIYKKIETLLNKPDAEFTVKDADALAKLKSSMEKLVGKKFQIDMMFATLKEMLLFFERYYRSLTTEELLNAVTHFKNSKLETLGENPLTSALETDE